MHNTEHWLANIHNAQSSPDNVHNAPSSWSVCPYVSFNALHMWG